MKTEATGYWTFFCNPAIWEIDRFLYTHRKNESDTYRITNWQKDYFKPGQLGVIKVTTDKRSKAELNSKKRLLPGIYAIVEVIGYPIVTDNGADFYIDKEEKTKPRLRVEIRFIENLINNPLLIKDLKSNNIINQDKYIINSFQGSSMPLKAEAYAEIERILNLENVYNNTETENVNTIEKLLYLEMKYQNAAPQIKTVISKKIERGEISREIKKAYNYKCCICDALGQNPLSFLKTSGDYYIETHHIESVSKGGLLGISNLITVCANHHRQFHYGNIDIIRNTDRILDINIDGKVLSINKLTINF